jgi:hypothetical protein
MTTSPIRKPVTLALALGVLGAWPASADAQSTPPERAGASDVAPAADATARPREDRAGSQPRERRARRHRQESSTGRDFDLLWFGPEIGVSIVDLKMISYDGLLPEQIDVSETGLGFGAAAGVKLKILSVGLHLAVGQFGDFDVWAVNLDGQLRIPLGFVEPYIRLGLGYAFLGSFSGRVDMQGVDVDGWDVQAGFGIDLYPSDFFSLGAGADFTVLNLSRTDSITAVDFTQDGAAVGVAVFLQAKAALHF